MRRLCGLVAKACERSTDSCQTLKNGTISAAVAHLKKVFRLMCFFGFMIQELGTKIMISQLCLLLPSGINELHESSEMLIRTTIPDHMLAIKNHNIIFARFSEIPLEREKFYRWNRGFYTKLYKQIFSKWQKKMF